MRKGRVLQSIRNRRRIWYRDQLQQGAVPGVQFQLFDEFDDKFSETEQPGRAASKSVKKA